VLVEHEKWMKAALSLANRGLGNVAPNPAVGCLLVKDGVVVGRGWTQPGGRPHAETCALAMAGPKARGATAYITLEPCAHHGQTPPCADALVKGGVALAVIACTDPDNRVAGKGIALLSDSGIETKVGVLGVEAKNLNAGFFSGIERKRPFFTLKTAATLDGRTATNSGESKWLTDTEARTYGHKLRATHDGILVGVNTVISDDPSLACRIEGLRHRSPRPIILDSELRTPVGSQLIQNARTSQPLLICEDKFVGSKRGIDLAAYGADLLAVHNTRDLEDVSKNLVKQGLTRILVEGGSQVMASFVKARYCDRVVAFMSGKIVGADGLASIGAIGLAKLADAPHLTLETIRKIGPDLLATYVNAE